MLDQKALYMFSYRFAASQKSIVGLMALTAALSLSYNAVAGDKKPVPADKFDLSHWNITLPVDENKEYDTR